MQSTTIIALAIGAAIIAAAVVLGTQVFQENTADATRDALMSEMKDLAGESLKHFTKPAFLGGGGKSFKNLDKMKRKNSKARGKEQRGGKGRIPQGTEVWETEVGIYSVLIAAQDSAVINGIGDVIGRDGETPVSVQMVVKKNSQYFKILN